MLRLMAGAGPSSSGMGPLSWCERGWLLSVDDAPPHDCTLRGPLRSLGFSASRGKGMTPAIPWRAARDGDPGGEGVGDCRAPDEGAGGGPGVTLVGLLFSRGVVMLKGAGFAAFSMLRAWIVLRVASRLARRLAAASLAKVGGPKAGGWEPSPLVIASSRGTGTSGSRIYMQQCKI